MSGSQMLGIVTVGAVLLAIAVLAQRSAGQKNSASGQKQPENAVDSVNYLTIPFKTIAGNDTSLADFTGKVVLIINTASECGFTPQYDGLEKLYVTYKDKGLVVVGFPANNFGGQEPGSNQEIATFCSTKFHVTFPMMAKVSVKGKDKHPLFGYLTERSPLTGAIKWNFGKFLLDRNGVLVARYGSTTKPSNKELVAKIESLL